MNKFFIVSDVHGFYDEMRDALDDAGFDPTNENHWLISCGDVMDRGPQPREMLQFLNNLPRKVLIRGNHETLMEDAIRRRSFALHDVHNGTVATAVLLANETNPYTLNDAKILECVRNDEDYKWYQGYLVNYFETEHYIFVHSWIAGRDRWRDASHKKWNKVMWGNPFDIAQVVGNTTGKTIVHGHWTNSYWWSQIEDRSEYGDDAKFDIAYHDECIGLDACTALSKKVNVLVIEDEFMKEI